MAYRLTFKDEALKEWHKLDSTLREQFKKKLAERVQGPRVPTAKLSGHADRRSFLQALCSLASGVPLE